jgi:hypothetical protein
VLNITKQFNSIVRDADLGVAVERAAASTRQVSMAAQTTIEVGSPLWTALRDLDTTTYIMDSECSPFSSHLRF